MIKRKLYLAAYDIADKRRLRHALGILKGYASGGQKSVFECYLSPGERRHLLRDLLQIINEDEDRFFLVHLDEKRTIHVFGIAVKPSDPACFYVG